MELYLDTDGWRTDRDEQRGVCSGKGVNWSF